MIKAKPIVDKDKGLKALQKRLESHKGDYVKVGIVGQKADQQHAGSNYTNAEIGTVHEFGLGNAPERSFIRSTVDEKQPEYVALQRRIGRGLISGKIKSKLQGLDLLGMKVKADIIAKIRSNIAPALSPKTIAAKGSSVALIDSGQLVQAIDHEVVKKSG